MLSLLEALTAPTVGDTAPESSIAILEQADAIKDDPWYYLDDTMFDEIENLEPSGYLKLPLLNHILEEHSYGETTPSEHGFDLIGSPMSPGLRKPCRGFYSGSYGTFTVFSWRRGPTPSVANIACSQPKTPTYNAKND